MRVARRRTARLALAALVAVLAAPTGSASAAASASAAVTDPADGGQVQGFVTLTAWGTTSQSGSSLELFLDGRFVTESACSGGSCTVSWSWDTTTTYGRHVVTAEVVAAAQVLATSAPVTLQVGAPPLSLVSSPAAGGVVSGVVTVSGGGTVDRLQPDTVAALDLLVDGVAVGSIGCTGSDNRICLGSLAWDSTGLTGTHTLALRLRTAGGQSATSAAVPVTVVSPGPSAVVTAPAAGAVVGPDSVIGVTGLVDPTQTDAGASMRLLVDGRTWTTVPCPAGQRSCPVTAPWTATGVPGQHQLSAVFTTASGRTAASTVVPVWVYGPARLSLAPVATTPAGRRVTLAGRVVDGTGSPIRGAVVHVVVRNAVGAVQRAGVFTAADGNWSAGYAARSDATVTVTVAGTARWGSAVVVRRTVVTPVPVCRLAAVVALGRVDHLSCRLGAVPRGTAIALQQHTGGHWHNVVRVRTTGPTWTLAVTPTRKGTAYYRVVVGASSAFATTRTAGTAPARDRRFILLHLHGSALRR